MIKTERLNIIPVEVTHGKGLFKLWSNHEVIKYTYNKIVNEISECEEWISSTIEKLKNEKHIGPFTVFLNEKIIGFMGAPAIDLEKGEYKFFYQFDVEYWGKGYGYEAAKGLMEHMLADENVEAIYAEAVTTNKASIKILKKLGMEEIEVIKGGFKKGEITLDLLKFRITRRENEKI